MNSDIAPEAVGGLLALGILGIGGVIVVFFIAVAVAICLVVQGCFKRIPPEHQQMQPGLVWLLLIPCFSLIWNFFVFLKLADSFKSYFDSQGVTDVGDCGKTLGLAYCIAACCCFLPIPYVGCLVAVAAIVLLILVLLKANELKNRIPAAA